LWSVPAGDCATTTLYRWARLYRASGRRRTLSASGAAPIDEAAIFAAYARLREHEARAVTETKRARRVRVRRPVSALSADEPAAEVDVPALSSFAEIVPFAIEKLK
jgi:hypothetical protein